MASVSNDNNHGPSGNNMCDCVIEDLLTKPFSSRDDSEKMLIRDRGRPSPEMPGLSVRYSDRNREYIKQFSVANYEYRKWLTGCPRLNKLFCWPCLLFSTEKNQWANEGYSNITGLSHALSRHEKSHCHISCSFSLCVFGNVRTEELNPQKSISKYNEMVKKNRETLLRLIDVVCYLGKQKLTFRVRDESEVSLNRGNYIETLNLLKEYDHTLDDHLRNSRVFRGTSPTIQKQVIEAVGEILINAMKREVAASSFVALILDECSDILSKSKLSTVLRYVNAVGEVKESFIGFVDVSADRPPEVLYQHISSVVDKFSLSRKLIAFSCDGRIISSQNIKSLEAKLKEKCLESTMFVHSYYPDLNTILQSSLAEIKECRLFFRTLSSLADFFSNSMKRKESLFNFVQKSTTLDPTDWDFTSKLVETVNNYKDQFIDFFEQIIQPENVSEWDADTVVLAQGFLSVFRQFETVFLLQVFAVIFKKTDDFFCTLQSRMLDTIVGFKKVTETKNFLYEFQKKGFQKVWKAAVEQYDGEFPGKRRRLDESPEEVYSVLFLAIVDDVRLNISERFYNLQVSDFCSFINPDNFKSYLNNFPDALLTELIDQYVGTFEQVSLRSELYVLYTCPHNSIFANKTVQEVIALMHEKDLIWVMPEVFKLASLYMMLPSVAPSVGKSYPALRRIKSYCQSVQSKEEVSAALSVIAIERELLYRLRYVDVDMDFNNAVTEVFIKKSGRSDFNFK